MDKEKVNLQIDYLSTQSNKLYLTIAAAEALGRVRVPFVLGPKQGRHPDETVRH